MFYDIRGMRLRNDGGNAHANKIKKVSSTVKMEDTVPLTSLSIISSYFIMVISGIQ